MDTARLKARRVTYEALRNARPEVRARTAKVKEKSQLRRYYNITPEQKQARFEKQKGLCAICGKPQKLQVDHCHKTGKFRGLLCGSCNRFLALPDREGLAVLDRIHRYLKYELDSQHDLLPSGF